MNEWCLLFVILPSPICKLQFLKPATHSALCSYASIGSIVLSARNSAFLKEVAITHIWDHLGSHISPSVEPNSVYVTR